jgi:uncharacterized membrane protein (DUF373 family)
MTEPEQKQSLVAMRASRILGLLDNVILGAVAFGTVATAVILLHDLALDVIRQEKHHFTHLLGEVMFVVIVMELFRQVLRQIMRQPFSLQPFMTIGVIVCIRAILLTQMKLGSDEIEWVEGTVLTGVSALTVLLLMASSYLYHKIKEPAGSQI